MPGVTPSGLPAASPTFGPPARPGRTTAFVAGLALAKNRLVGRPALVVTLLCIAVSIAGGIIERHAGSAGAVDRALLGTFGLVVPLASFWIVSMVTTRDRLDRAVWSVARFGVARRDVALGLTSGAVLAAASLSALVALASVFVAGQANASARDALTCVWIAALTAAAYVGWFSLGTTFLSRGRASAIVLAVDFMIGGTGAAGLVLPRGNAVNLLGGAAPLGLGQPSSTAILLTSAVALSIVAALRSGG
jgi:hypothetical protein